MLFSENWGLELFSVVASYENSSTGSLGLRGPHPVICTLSCWWRDSWLKRLVMITLSLCVLVNWDLIECALRRVKWWSAWFGGVRMNGDASVKDLHLLKWLVIWTWCCKEVRMETHLSVCVAVSVLCLAPPQHWDIIISHVGKCCLFMLLRNISAVVFVIVLRKSDLLRSPWLRRSLFPDLPPTCNLSLYQSIH